MNDRFKVRAFEKDNSTIGPKMHYYDSIEICDNGVWFNNDEFDLGENHCDSENIILMQCIGLKDKNGKLIFEGDILRSEYGYEDTPYTIDGWVQWGNMHDRIGWYIGFERPGNPDEAYDQKVFIEDFENSEIIGNIYENPELLTPKQC